MCTHIAPHTPNPFTHMLVHTTHPARICSPTGTVLGSLRVLWTLTHPPGSTFARSDTLLSGLPGHQTANTEFPIIGPFSGGRGGRGLGGGSRRAGGSGCRASGEGLAWGRTGVGGEPARRAPAPNPAGARGLRGHLSSHYCNKSGLHYMKGKMNYRR